MIRDIEDAAAKHVARKIFKSADRDNTGTVNIVEFEAWGAEAGIELSDEENRVAASVFDTADVDKDGQLTWKEARAALMLQMEDPETRDDIMDAAAVWFEQNDGSPSGKLN